MASPEDLGKSRKGNHMSIHRKQFVDKTFPHLAALLSSAQWLTMRSSLAEKLVSDTMAHAYGDWDQTEDSISIKARLFRSLYQEFSDSSLRSTRAPWLVPKQNYRVDPEDNVVLQSMDGDLRSQELTLLRALPTATVRDAVSRLSARSRFIMLLLFREQFSYAEIGYITGLRLDSIRAILSRLRRLVPHYLVHRHDGRAPAPNFQPEVQEFYTQADDDLCAE